MRRVRKSNLLAYIVLTILAVLWFIPLYLALTTSLKTPREVSEMNYLAPPAQPQIENYVDAWNSGIGLGLFNSIIISIPTTLICLLLGSWSGYFLSRFRFKHAPLVFFIATIATFMPYQIVLIPITQLIASLNLGQSHLGLIFAYTLLNTPLATLVTATFFTTIPKELEEAAYIDGCGPIRIYWNIILPVAKPALASAAILVFTQVWNEFLIALTLSTPSTKPVTPIVAELKGNYVAQWHIQMAGAVLAVLPPLILFLFMGKYFIRGLLAGTLKA